MHAESSPVRSSQRYIHERLPEVVRRHRDTPFRRPPAEHTTSVFRAVRARLVAEPRELVLDAGCGTGESTRLLAADRPDCWVVGIDRSARRLGRQGCDGLLVDGNLLLVRAELQDFWRLAAAHGWRCREHHLLYPNPWPKARHLMRRWHAHPVFPTVLALGGRLELRSNWRIFAEEFALSLEIHGYEPDLSKIEPSRFISPFERKYARSGHTLYRVSCIIGV